MVVWLYGDRQGITGGAVTPGVGTSVFHPQAIETHTVEVFQFGLLSGKTHTQTRTNTHTQYTHTHTRNHVHMHARTHTHT